MRTYFLWAGALAFCICTEASMGGLEHHTDVLGATENTAQMVCAAHKPLAELRVGELWWTQTSYEEVDVPSRRRQLALVKEYAGGYEGMRYEMRADPTRPALICSSMQTGEERVGVYDAGLYDAAYMPVKSVHDNQKMHLGSERERYFSEFRVLGWWRATQAVSRQDASTQTNAGPLLLISE